MQDDRCELLCLDLELAERLRSRRLDPETANHRAIEAKALGDPTRLTIAAAVVAGEELCVCDIAWVMERSDNLVSHHLRQLRSAGLVRSRRDGKMVLYSPTARGSELLGSALSSPAPA